MGKRKIASEEQTGAPAKSGQATAPHQTPENLRQRAEAELLRRNRTLRMLSQANQRLIRATEEMELLQAICQIVVEEGGYRLAWVGYAEHDEGKTVRPVAQMGFEEGYLATADITWADTEHGRGPTGVAIRTGRPALARNIPNDPNYAPWRAAAIQRGYRSSIALPLPAQDAAFGALSIYAAEAEAFDDAEIRLLQELAGDLAFGIETLRARQEQKKSAARLQASEDKFRYVFDHSTIGMSITRPSGEIYVNSAFCEMLGYGPEELKNRKWQEITHPDDIALTQTAVDQLFSGEKESVHFIKRYFHKNGSMVWAEVGTALRRDQAGQPDYLLTTVNDITERKQAEAHLTYQARLLATVNDAIVAADEQYRLTTWNAAAEAMYGWQAEEVLGRNGIEVLRTEYPGADPEAMRRQITEIGAWRGEATQLRKDGSRIPVEVASIVLHDAVGRVTGYVSVIRNITERKRAEERLNQALERLELATRAGGLGIWDWDIRRNEHVWNDQMYELFGTKPGDFDGTYEAWLARVHPDDRAAGDEMSRRAQRGGQGYDTEYRILWPDGTVRVLRSVGQFVRGAAGQPLRMTGITYDITERKQAEAALDRERRLLRTVIDNVPDQIFAHDRDGCFILNNRSDARILGMSDPETLLGKNDRDFYPPELAARFQADDRQVIESGQPLINREEPSLTPEGNRRWVLTTKVPLRDGLGQVIGVVGIARDITERKQAEAALRESEARFRSLYENSTVGLYRTTPDGRILLANPTLVGLLGYSSFDELAARNLEQDGFAPAYDRAQFLEVVEREGEVKGLESSWTRRDGTAVFIQESARAIRDPQGRTLHYDGIIEDITERKQAEEALRETSVRLTHMLANSPTVIYALKVEGDQAIPVWVSGNIEPILGFKAEDALQPEWWPERLHPQDRARVLASLGHLFDDFYQHDYRFLRKDGRLVWLHDEHRLLRDAGNRPREIVGAWTDITARKQAEQTLNDYSARLEADVAQRTQELRDAQEQLIRHEKLAVLGQLASSVAHELRNPLGVIANAVYFLRAVQPNADAAILDYLGIIAAEVNNADRIVSDLLDFARLKGVARETVSLAALVEGVLQKYPPSASVAVAIEGLDPLPPLFVDPRQIEQVLANLVMNACQAMPEGGALTLRAEVVSEPMSASPEPSWVALHVADTGIGVSPDNMNRLFEPLFTTKAKGIGLGLAVSKKLIEANEGKIEVRSEPGQGSTFTVFLPLEDRSKD